MKDNKPINQYMSESMHPTILLVDDDRRVMESLGLLFEDDYQTLTATSGPEAINLVKAHPEIAVAVLDMKMTPMDGLVTAVEIEKIRPGLAIIFHTGYPGEYQEEEIESARRPFDYIEKGQSVHRLVRSVANAVERHQLRSEAGAELIENGGAFGMIGRSTAMRAVFDTIRKVARSEVKVVICGETGTGKELVARAIHAHSARSGRHLGIFNCNHKSPDLVESELFGHVKGSFTGAYADAIGHVDKCDGGTLFLDEIGDLDITTQAKLLRVLERGEYQRLGDPTIRHSDFRLVCATHRNLEELVKQDKFREDLYYRLKGVEIQLPALRCRKEDIPLLVDKFLDRFTIEQDCPPKTIHPDALDMLITYDWPGNVRQLLTTIQTLAVITESNVILPADVGALLAQKDRVPSGDLGGLHAKVESYRRALVVEALEKCGHNIAEAARQLKVDRANLRKYVVENKIPLE